MSAAPVPRGPLRAGLAVLLMAVMGGTLAPIAWAGQTRDPKPLDPKPRDPKRSDALGAIGRANGQLGQGAWCVHAGAPTVGPPVVDRLGHVAVATTDGHVHSFERRGRYRWSHTLSGAVAGPVTLRPTDGALWVGTTDRQIYSIASNGRLQWRVSTVAPVATGLVRQNDGSLLYGSVRALYAVTALGGARWRMDLGATVNAVPVPGPPGITWVAAGRELLRVEGAWRLRRLPLPGEALGPPLKLDDGVAIVAGGDLLVFDDDGQLRWSRGDVAVASVTGRGGLVAVSPRGEVRWLGAGGHRRDGEPRGGEPPAKVLLGAPAAAPRVFAGVAYVPLLSGELVGVDRRGQVVRRWRLSSTPLGELALDPRGGRLLATVSGGRICSVPLVE